LSSVLRALQKLEQENSAAAGMPGKTAGKTRSGFFYVNPVWQQRMLGILAVLVLIMSVTVVMLVRKPGPVPGDTSGSMATLYLPDDTESPVLSSPRAEERSTHPVSGPLVESRLPQTEEPVNPSGQLPDIAIPIDFEENAMNTSQHDTQDQQGADIPADAVEPGAPFRAINQDTVLPMETISPSSPSPDMIKVRPADDFPPLAPDAGLTLQAISWSPEPARRLAVINGRLCREGEPVDGFVVVRINQDDVLLSDGRISGKLVFQIR